MAIKLTWNASSETLDSVKIYRSNTTINKNSPPAPIATIAGDAVEYNDDTALSNTLYYYAIATVKGATVVWSDILPMANCPNTGPGPKEILRGNWEKGFFGLVNSADFITAAGINSQLATSLNIINSAPQWFKCAYRGKVLFVPVLPLFSASWVTLYRSGLVYGMDNNGAPPAVLSSNTQWCGGAWNVNQFRTVTVGTDQFLVRMPRIDDDTTVLNEAASPVPAGKGEWRDLIGLMWYPRSNVLPAGESQRYTDLDHTTNYCHCANFRNSAYGLLIDNSNWPFATIVFSSYSDSGYNFLPILEMVL